MQKIQLYASFVTLLKVDPQIRNILSSTVAKSVSTRQHYRCYRSFLWNFYTLSLMKLFYV